MAKIKHTKNELKAQNEALKRYERFLPMLLLKKQQLQAEIQRIDTEVSIKTDEEKNVHSNLENWIHLFSEAKEIKDIVILKSVKTDEGNIAGVNIPILDRIDIEQKELDLFKTPTWLDDAQEVTGKIIQLRIERETLVEQKRLVEEELRTTSQRVNLFEKVKIPECKENIRVIKIFLGDEQTAAVARGKLAKKRTEDYQYLDEAA
ncbi:V-type ATP synthase subunit D [Verrucomicrobiota bacterium]